MLSTATRAHSAAFVTVTTQVQRPCKSGPDDWPQHKQRNTCDKLCTTCRDALQALVSPTDAQLALCSSGAYGEKEGEGPDKGTLPAQIELEKLSKRWNVPTGLHTATASDHKASPPLGFSHDRPSVQGYPDGCQQLLLRLRPYPVRGHRLQQHMHT